MAVRSDEATQETRPRAIPTVDPPAAGDGATPAPTYPVYSSPDPFDEHPERYVGAAFAGGFVLAKVLGRLGRG